MKTIFITGASSGLGKATTKLFASKGWKVIATMRNPEKNTELSKLPNVHLLELDVCNPSQIVAVAEQSEKISPIDVVFNNAGYALGGAIEALTDEQLEHQFNTNVLGTIRVTRAFLPYFRKRGKGLIITTTSSSAYIPEPFLSIYRATKSALESWTEGASFELNKIGVGIKSIVPGFMNTNFVANSKIALHPAYQDWLNKVIAVFSNPELISKADNPEDIALVVFEAATDGKKQLHYIAGNDAKQGYSQLQNEGLDAVIEAREKYFFEN